MSLWGCLFNRNLHHKSRFLPARCEISHAHTKILFRGLVLIKHEASFRGLVLIKHEASFRGLGLIKHATWYDANHLGQPTHTWWCRLTDCHLALRLKGVCFSILIDWFIFEYFILALYYFVFMNTRPMVLPLGRGCDHCSQGTAVHLRLHCLVPDASVDWALRITLFQHTSKLAVHPTTTQQKGNNTKYNLGMVDRSWNVGTANCVRPLQVQICWCQIHCPAKDHNNVSSVWSNSLRHLMLGWTNKTACGTKGHLRHVEQHSPQVLEFSKDPGLLPSKGSNPSTLWRRIVFSQGYCLVPCGSQTAEPLRLMERGSSIQAYWRLRRLPHLASGEGFDMAEYLLWCPGSIVLHSWQSPAKSAPEGGAGGW